MYRRRELDETELKVLRTLRKTVLEEKGWRRAGVRGWLLGPEINSSAGSSIGSLYLPRLRHLGLVLGEMAKDPGRQKGMALWRLTQDGEAELAGAERREPAYIPPPASDPRDEGVIYISANAWACLGVLQKHHPHWVRWSQVVEEARKRYRTWVYGSDMKILASRGLVEREDEQLEGQRKVIWYRGTLRGRAAKLLDDKANPDWVQIRLPAEEGG